MRPRWAAVLPLVLALGVALLTAAGAHAEIIDFDPEQDEVPEILTTEELARYDALLEVQRPSVSSTVSPDGRYVLVRVARELQVLDTEAKTFAPLVLEENMSIGSPIVWTGPAEGVAMTYVDLYNDEGEHVGRKASRTVFDFAAPGYASTEFSVPELPGRFVSLVPGLPLIQTADGRLHAVAYTLTTGQGLIEIDRPSYDSRTREELEELGLAEPAVKLLQSEEQLVAVALADGSPTTIGALPPRSDLGAALYSLSSRPDASTVAYVVQRYLPWRGTVVGDRPFRGGGMPTGFWNTQEALGLVPEAENHHITGTSLRVVDLDTGTEIVVPNVGRTPGKFSDTVWTADGSVLAVISHLPAVLEGRPHPIYEEAAGVKISLWDPVTENFLRTGIPLANYDPPMDAPFTSFTPLDGPRMLVTVGVNTTRHLYAIDIRSPNPAEAEPVYTGDAMLWSYAMAGGTFVATLGDVTDPGELYVAQTEDVAGTLNKLTDSNPDLAAASNIAYRTFTFTTSHGYELSGQYVYPGDWEYPPPEPKPAVVWQAGGPGGQMYNMWGTSVEGPFSLLPNFGIPVIIVNGSGRLSNGASFYTDMADGTNYGQRDIEDIREAVEHLVGLGVVDPDAVGVTGCSYGGYFTLQSMTADPGFYAAGNAQCSLNDLLYEWNFGWSPIIAYLMGDSATGDPREFVRDSPLYNAHKVANPLLIFHGTEDFLPFEQMTNFHDQVASSGVQTRMLRAHGYGHGFGTIRDIDPGGRKAQRYAAQLQIDWFRQHLGPGDAPPPRTDTWRLPALPRLPMEEVSYQ